MKKLILVLIAILFFWVSYQLRLGFIATGDYNEPSDYKEYKLAANGAEDLLLMVTGRIPEDWKSNYVAVAKHIIGSVNIHGTPLYNIYLGILASHNLVPQSLAVELHALFVAAFFLVLTRLFPYWVAVVMGITATIYTPIFAFVYSWMPESVLPMVIPMALIGVSYLVIKQRHPVWFVLAGFGLFLLGFARHIFSFYGIAYITLILFMRRKLKRKQIVALIAGFVVPTVFWRMLLLWSGSHVYAEGNVISTVLNAHRLSSDGWWMAGINNLTWGKVLSKILLEQNPVSLFLLELERIHRFWRNPANSYASSFPFVSQAALQSIHYGTLFFALWGFRAALRRKFIFFVATLIVWNTLFVSAFYVEEIRYQLPVIALLLLLAGAGLQELSTLLADRVTRWATIGVSLLYLFWGLLEPHVFAIELWLVPFISDSSIWRLVHILLSAYVMALVTKRFWLRDRKAILVFRHRNANKLLTALPLIFFSIIIAPALRSRTWHQWRAPLRSNQRAEQHIRLKESDIANLTSLDGYLLIDLQDANAGQYLRVTVNGRELGDRLPLGKRVSTVDLMAVRQWQRTVPRLGSFAPVEDDFYNATSWPNLHEWFVIPLSGNILQKDNLITVENQNILFADPAYIFGDYSPYGSRNYYEGPTARLYQGQRTHNKYQVEGDMRLTERRMLQSAENQSTFVYDGRVSTQDLSLLAGKQIGRYRIFFLFPFTGGDPEDIF